jgi:ABC-type branched-subunit amino acid transport system substrate-binding protein
VHRGALAASSVALILALSGCVMEEETLPSRPPVQQVMVPPTPPPSPSPAEPSGPPVRRVDLGGKTDIAVLLPETGQGAAIGRDMLDAAQLALAELGSDDLALTPKDTKGTPEGAAAAARAAIADGAKLIIGPRTAGETQAVAPIAQAAGIAVLSFSNQARIGGNGVFVLGFLPEQEARRLADYAVSTGIKSFAVLAPADAYGQLVTESFRAAVGADGGSIQQVQTYDPASHDPRPAIDALAADKNGFQGLLLPEPTAARLEAVAAVLPAYKIGQPDIRLLGIDGWDAPNIGAQPALVGGWYVAPSPDARAGFVERFTRTYGHAPGRLATLAYDAVGVAAVLQKTPGAGFSVQALTNPSGFAGADGIFRLRPDGTSERGLAVLEVAQDGPTVVDAAPESFRAAGH